jgi:hypothetical protein
MKKLFVLFAAATLFVGVQACKPAAEPEQETEVTETEVVDEVAPAVDTTAVTTVDSTATPAPAQ